MGVEAKHSYRFAYLRSDKWSEVRMKALVRERAKCQICSEENVSNDAHHVFYPASYWNTSSDCLVVLCRPCHQFVHALIELRVLSSGKDKEENQFSIQRLVDAVSCWRIEKSEALNNDIPQESLRRISLKNSSHLILLSIVRGKMLACMVCLEKDPSCRRRFPVGEKYGIPPCKQDQALHWCMCDRCYAEMRDAVDWPVDQSGVTKNLWRWYESNKKKHT